MKEIKDYLHLYLGCLVEYDGRIGIIHTYYLPAGKYMEGKVWVCSLEENGNPEMSCSAEADKCKPLLRPLSDMTQEEENHLAKICFDNKDYFIITSRTMGYGHGETEIHESVKCLKIETFCEHPDIKDWIPAALLQIDYEDRKNPIILGRFYDRGKILKDDMIENPFELTAFLLSKHVDLFGLIKSGLAIDKTTLK